MVRSIAVELDPGSKEPLYRQIFDQVVARIRSGAFPAGFQLPPTRRFAAQVNTHRNTVVRAYEELETCGFVRSEVGRGTFVLGAPEERPRSVPASDAAIPWTSLVSRASMVEPLGRYDRISAPGSQADVINLTRMQPSEDLLPNEQLRHCIDHTLRRHGARALGYSPREGLPRLRGLIAEDLARQGVPTRAEDVVITTGSQQALDLIARALINPGDTLLVESTTYTGALNLFAAAGARLVSVPSDDDGPNLDALNRLTHAGAKAFYLMPNCHNPTGAVVSEPRRRALTEWSRQAGVPLIEDDYGADLQLEAMPPPVSLRALDADVLYVGTFSKKLIPALRVGFLVCPPALRRWLVPLRHAMDLGTSSLLQHALAEFLERGYLSAHLGRVRAEYRARRDALHKGLQDALPTGITWRLPEHGVAMWLKLPPTVSPEVAYMEARRKGVLVSPGTLHAVDPGERQGGIRLTFCAEPVVRLKLGARRLGNAFRNVMAQPRGSGASALEIV